MKQLKESKVSMREVLGKTIQKLSQEDEKVYVLDGDLATSTKIDTVARENPQKFLQMGIAEQNMMSVASGLAATGLKPWTFSFAAFLSKRAIDQIQVQVAQPNLNVKMVGGYSGLLTGLAGKTHQALEDIAIFRSLANMMVLAPADSIELAQMLECVNQIEGPVYIRVGRDTYPVIFTDHYQFAPGRAVKLKDGSDAAVISTGTETSRAIQAGEQLEKEGLSVSIIHMPSIKPLDKNAIIEAANLTGAVVTAEEHSIIGGLGSAVAEVLVENKPVPMARVGVKGRNSESAPNEALLKKYELTADHVAKAVKQVLKRKS